MYCERCGHELDDRVKFCDRCGMLTNNPGKKRKNDIIISTVIVVVVLAIVVGLCWGMRQQIDRLRDYYRESSIIKNNATEEKSAYDYYEKQFGLREDGNSSANDSKVYASNYPSKIYRAVYTDSRISFYEKNSYQDIDLDEETKEKVMKVSERYKNIAWDSEYKIDENSPIVISEAAWNVQKGEGLLLGITNIGDKPYSVYARAILVNSNDKAIYDFAFVSKVIEPGSTDVSCFTEIEDYSSENRINWIIFECEEAEGVEGEYETDYTVKTNKKNGKVSLDITLTNTLDVPEAMYSITAVLTDENGKVCGSGYILDEDMIEGKSSKSYKIYIDGTKEQMSQYKNINIYANPVY